MALLPRPDWEPSLQAGVARLQISRAMAATASGLNDAFDSTVLPSVLDSAVLEPTQLPQVMEQAEYTPPSAGELPNQGDYLDPAKPAYPSAPAVETFSSPSSYNPSQSPWPSYGSKAVRQGSGSDSGGGAPFDGPPGTSGSPRFLPTRPPGPMRTPSSTYNPLRRPPQFISTQSKRSSSNTRRALGRNADREYPAHENAYVRQLRQEPTAAALEYYGEPYTPSLGYSSLSDDEDESPASEAPFEDDYDQDTQLFYHAEEIQPSVEEMQVPENRERLEWYSMLASVLRGDVVKQEKQRIIGTNVKGGDKGINHEIWLGVRAKVCGRSFTQQRLKLEEARAKVGADIEAIIAFQIKGESEAGKPASAQVQDMVEKIEQCESLYPTRLAFEAANPRAASDEFRRCCDAVMAWHNTTMSMNTELSILQKWVGNEELDFSKGRESDAASSALTDDSSFIDRVLKEEGLKSLQGDRSLLIGAAQVIRKAKISLIENAEESARRHLPLYIEELLTLINFPSRLIQEVIRMRVKYARRMKESAQQPTIMTEQIIAQFQILLKLAISIKLDYLTVSQPEPGWELPPCIDENFDASVLSALKYYFTLLNQRLAFSKNTFKETEILDQEWEFCNEVGRHLENGDVEVAEQFSGLTAKALHRMTTHFERELQRKPETESSGDHERRYKTILDSVRVRQRKLFRFSRLLNQRFENATEYSIGPERELLPEIYQNLQEMGHFMIVTPNVSPSDVVLIAPPSLRERPRQVLSILGTSSYGEHITDDTITYVLMVRPEQPLEWYGDKMELDMRPMTTDVQTGRIRLVSEGSQQRLIHTRQDFLEILGINLDVVAELRANLPRVNAELIKIKKLAYKLTKTIVDSVGIIRAQTRGLDYGPELIQTCFAFAAEFGKRSLGYMTANQRFMNNQKLLLLALDWISFICDDCEAKDRKTFSWAVVALEFTLAMTRGSHILGLRDDDFTRLRAKVAGCMSLLISHFDIMGARSTLAAQAKQRADLAGQSRRLDLSKLRTDREAVECVRAQWCDKLAELDAARNAKEAERRCLGRVLEDTNEADRSLTVLSSSATNVNLRWQQGAFVGGGTFGSVYAALNLDSGQLMAVKEIRLQDPHLIPTVAQQIRDEMGVLEVLDHPNIVEYYGIEVHRDKVYIFMEFCSGGSLANLLEHGRIEDETFTQVYALQMLEGLAHLHMKGIVHRDIKPESKSSSNPRHVALGLLTRVDILLDHNGIIKYVDFGAAKVIARQGKTMAQAYQAQAAAGGANGHAHPSNGTSSNGPSGNAGPAARAPNKQKSMTGTPMYMSPEVIKGQGEGRQGAGDIWSLGCVVLEMATGRRPWATLDNEWAIMYNIAQGNPPQLPARDQLSPDGVDFLRRCFERDPRRRPSAAELLQHRWIMQIREQVQLGADSGGSSDAVATPSSEGGPGSDGVRSGPGSRQNSSVY